MTKVGVAAFIGALVVWYDYFLYGLAASVVFTKLFFPSENPLIGTLAAFATFGVGFFFRPLGGAIFGHYGDRLGRKAILVLTLLIMGLATFLIGVLPTFQSVGLLAPLLLVVLRPAGRRGRRRVGRCCAARGGACPRRKARFLRQLAPDGVVGRALDRNRPLHRRVVVA
jgi:MFS family permease